MTLLIAVACAVICARAGMDNLTYILTGFSMGYIVKCVAIGLEEAIYEAAQSMNSVSSTKSQISRTLDKLNSMEQDADRGIASLKQQLDDLIVKDISM